MSGGIEKDLTQLEKDIVTYADEAWNHKDIIAGLKLLGVLAGIGGAIGLGIGFFTSVVPGIQAIGIPVSGAVTCKLIKAGIKGYDDLDDNARAIVRKTARFLGKFV